jgi:hypothetical protein
MKGILSPLKQCYFQINTLNPKTAWGINIYIIFLCVIQSLRRCDCMVCVIHWNSTTIIYYFHSKGGYSKVITFFRFINSMMIFCNRNITNNYCLLNCKTKSKCELRTFYQQLHSSSPWNHIKDINFMEII